LLARRDVPAILAELERRLAAKERPALLGQHEPAVVVRARIAEHDELADHRAPGAARELGAGAVHGERLVAMLPDLVRRVAEQHVDDVRGAETLAGAVYGRQELSRRLGRIPRRGRIRAVVAVAAALRCFFAEVL